MTINFLWEAIILLQFDCTKKDLHLYIHHVLNLSKCHSRGGEEYPEGLSKGGAPPGTLSESTSHQLITLFWQVLPQLP